MERDGTARRRNRRADQFRVHFVADEQHIPVYSVEFKAPHKVTIPELAAGLHQTDLARDVIDQEGDTFEFYATRLAAACSHSDILVHDRHWSPIWLHLHRRGFRFPSIFQRMILPLFNILVYPESRCASGR